MDLSSRQSMLLMQVAHVHLMFGQVLLHRLLVLLSLLLFLLLQDRVSGDSEEQNEISAVRICEPSFPRVFHTPSAGLLQLCAERCHL